MIKIVLFNNDDHGRLGSVEAYRLYERLRIAGHSIQEEAFDCDNYTLLQTAWLEFETEDDAALFKLTHL